MDQSHELPAPLQNEPTVGVNNHRWGTQGQRWGVPRDDRSIWYQNRALILVNWTVKPLLPSFDGKRMERRSKWSRGQKVNNWLHDYDVLQRQEGIWQSSDDSYHEGWRAYGRTYLGRQQLAPHLLLRKNQWILETYAHPLVIILIPLIHHKTVNPY